MTPELEQRLERIEKMLDDLLAYARSGHGGDIADARTEIAMSEITGADLADHLRRKFKRRKRK